MTQFSILLALNLVALTIMFFYIKGKVRKTLEFDGLVDKLRAEVGELVRDLNQTTDRNITLFEDAIQALKEASTEADRKAVVLKRETERRSTESAVYDRLGHMRRGSITGADAGGKRMPLQAFESLPVQESASPELQVQTTDSPAGVSAEKYSQTAIPFVSFSSSPIRPKQPVKDEVLGLNRRGISSDFIAAKLGITVAEVELIISLEEQKGLMSREEGT